MAEKQLIIKIRGNDQLTGPIRKGLRGIIGLGRTIGRVNKRILSSFKGLFRMLTSMKTLVAGVIVGLATRQVIRDLALVERMTAEIATLIPDLGSDAFDQLSEDIRRVAVEGAQTFEDEFKAAYDAISAGVAPGQLLDFLRTANQLATGGVTDVATSVDLLTSVLNAYALSADQAADVSDVVFTAVRKGKTTVELLARSIFQVAPAAKAANVGIDQVGASLAALTAAGVPTKIASTNLRAAFLELGKAGTTANREFEAIAGEGFRDFMREGGSVVDAMRLMRERAEGSDRAVSDLFSSIEGGLAVQVLSTTGFKNLSETFRDMENRSGATQSAFETMAKTLDFSIRRAKTAARDLLVEVFEGLTPAIKAVIDGITGIATTISEAIKDSGFRDQLFATLGQAQLVAHDVGINVMVSFLEGVATVMVGSIGPLWVLFRNTIGAALVQALSTSFGEVIAKFEGLLGLQDLAAQTRAGVAELDDQLSMGGELFEKFQEQTTQSINEIASITGGAFTQFAESVHNAEIAVMPFIEQLADLGRISRQTADEVAAALDKMDEAGGGGETDSGGGLFKGIHEGIDDVLGDLKTVKDFGIDLGTSLTNSLASGFANVFDSILTGSKSAKEAFKDMARSILSMISKMIIQFLVLRALSSLFPSGGDTPGAAAGKHDGGFMRARMGGIIRQAMVPGFATGGVVASALALAPGGTVPGPNINRDIIPALLTPGEFVLRRSAAQQIGVAALNRMNRGESAGGLSVNLTVNVSGGMSQAQAHATGQTVGRMGVQALITELGRNPALRDAMRRELM